MSEISIPIGSKWLKNSLNAFHAFYMCILKSFKPKRGILPKMLNFHHFSKP